MSSPLKRITPEMMEEIALRFRALGEVSRLKIIKALMESDKNVSELVQATGLSQPNVSRHLNTLVSCRLIARRKEGLNAVYSIADAILCEICGIVCKSVSSR